jgi:hypothetical protein
MLFVQTLKKQERTATQNRTKAASNTRALNHPNLRYKTFNITSFGNFGWSAVMTKDIILEAVTNYPTSRRRVLLEKLTVPQLAKKYPAFCGNRKFITAFTTACHLSLSQNR